MTVLTVPACMVSGGEGGGGEGGGGAWLGLRRALLN